MTRDSLQIRRYLSRYGNSRSSSFATFTFVRNEYFTSPFPFSPSGGHRERERERERSSRWIWIYIYLWYELISPNSKRKQQLVGRFFYLCIHISISRSRVCWEFTGSWEWELGMSAFTFRAEGFYPFCFILY